MPPTAAELHERTETSVRAAMTTAMRADPVGIPAAIEELLARQWLDPHSIAFLDRARALVLGSTTALTAVLAAHRPTAATEGALICQFCGTPGPCWTLRRIAEIVTAYFSGPPVIDRAEAWRRADAWLHRDNGRRMLVAIEELGDLGYVARPVPYTPPVAPLPADDALLVIDAYTGRLTRWPCLPPARLADEYRDHLRRENPTRGELG